MGCIIILLVAWFTLCESEVRYSNIAIVVHSFDGNKIIQQFMDETFLRNMNVIYMTGNDDQIPSKLHHRNLKTIKYDGHPGNQWKPYKGIHRTLAGILAANITFSDIDWILVMDDDTVPNMMYVNKTLAGMDPSIPFLLGNIGPIAGGHAPCRNSSNSTHWSCCMSLSEPCYANIQEADRPGAVFVYNEQRMTFEPTYDIKLPNWCRSSLWPEGMTYGHPYQLDLKGTDFQPHVIHRLFPYGGSTYVLSRGMLKTIGKNNWKHYMDALRCRGTDVMVMYLVLNFGFSVTQVNFRAVHHVRDPMIMTAQAVKFLNREDALLMCQFYSNHQHEIVVHRKTSRVFKKQFYNICKRVNISFPLRGRGSASLSYLMNST